VTEVAAWQNVEDVVELVIRDLFPDGQTGTSTPDNLEARCPFGRVKRVGGGDIDPFTDRARIVVEVFSLTYAEGVLLAEDVRARLRSEPTPLDRVFTVSAPVEVPWADGSEVRRWTATYGVSLRRSG
jgi:hypothetical protein